MSEVLYQEFCRIEKSCPISASGLVLQDSFMFDFRPCVIDIVCHQVGNQ